MEILDLFGFAPSDQPTEKFLKRKSPSFQFMTVVWDDGDYYFELANTFDNEALKLAERKVGIVSNGSVDASVNEQFLCEMKPLQEDTNSGPHIRYGRLPSGSTRAHGVRIQDLIDPSKTNGCDHWVPAEYSIALQKFMSPIANLSYDRYGQTLYPILSRIFYSMLPMFHWVLSGIDKTKEGLGIENVINVSEVKDVFLMHDKLQVIVKMQDYQLQKSDTYEGEFHKEGLDSESIVAVGIYYFAVDNCVQGGALEIETAVPTNCGAAEELEKVSIKQIVSGKTVVVFDNRNDTYHRVANMSCQAESGSRKILAFFLVDPEKRIASSETVLVNWDDIALRVVKKWEKETNLDVPNELKYLMARFAIKDESIRMEREKILHVTKLKSDTERDQLRQRTRSVSD